MEKESELMQHCMIDLETLGTRPGAVLLSIGAVMFDPRTGDLGAEFYVELDKRQARFGMHVEENTLEWWEQQSPAARAVFDNEHGMVLTDALRTFGAYLTVNRTSDDIRVWGNGAAFDNVLLGVAYARTELRQPWNYRFDRCYRTVCAMFPDIKREQLGTHHNALDDAKSQARHLMEIVRSTTINLA